MTQAQKLSNLSQAFTAGALGVRNRLINGAFDIWQRNTSFTVGSSYAYTADRWCAAAGGANLSAGIGGGPSYHNALQITGAAGNTVWWMEQRIEAANVRPLLQGSGFIFSGQMYSTVPIAVTPTIMAATGSNGGNDWSANVAVHTGSNFSHPGGSVWLPFSFAVPVPDSRCVNGLSCRLMSTAGLTTGTIAFSMMQCEAGVIATPFEERQVGFELMLCQRYHNQNFLAYSAGYTQSGVGVNAVAMWSQPMRITPSVNLTTNAPSGPIGTPTVNSVNGWWLLMGASSTGSGGYIMNCQGQADAEL